MKPVVILRGKHPVYDPNENKVTIQFFFPICRAGVGGKAEYGEIDLINGDVPRIVVKANARVVVDRFNLKLDQPGDQRKEERRMKSPPKSAKVKS